MWRGHARWWFAAGEVVGGLATALLAVLLGSLLRPVVPLTARLAIVVVVAALVAGREFGLYRLWLPQNGRQVPQRVIYEGGERGALQFGFEMGTGLRTYMTSGLPHVLLVGILFLAPLPWALTAGAGFGAGRAVMALIRTAAPDAPRWDADLRRWARTIAAMLAVTMAGSVAVLVTVVAA